MFVFKKLLQNLECFQISFYSTITVLNGNKLYYLLCKRSNSFWKCNKKAFIKLSKLQGDKKKIINLANEYSLLDPQNELSKHSIFSFTATKIDSLTTNHKMLDKLYLLNMPEIRKIKLNYISYLDSTHITYVDSFLGNYIGENLQVLVLKGWNFMPMESLESGLKLLLPKVKKQIYLQAFYINEKLLKVIFEESRNCEQLIIMGCKVKNINPVFSINKNYTYSLKKLGVKETISENESQRLNRVSLRILMNALSNTNIKTTLEEIYVGTVKFYPLDQLNKVMIEYGFNIKILVSLLREEN